MYQYQTSYSFNNINDALQIRKLVLFLFDVLDTLLQNRKFQKSELAVACLFKCLSQTLLFYFLLLGYYVYMEAGQTKSGKFPNAQYASPQYSMGAFNCKFSFWYNQWHWKYGSDTRFRVLFLREGRETILWENSRGTRDQWKQQTLTLPTCPTDFQVMLLHVWLEVVYTT